MSQLIPGEEPTKDIFEDINEDWITSYMMNYAESLVLEETNLFTGIASAYFPGIELNLKSGSTKSLLEHLIYMTSTLYHYTPKEMQGIFNPSGIGFASQAEQYSRMGNLNLFAQQHQLLPKRDGPIYDSRLDTFIPISEQRIYSTVDPFDSRDELFSPFGNFRQLMSSRAPHYFLLRHIQAAKSHAEYFQKIYKSGAPINQFSVRAPLQEMVFQIASASVQSVIVYSLDIDEVENFVRGLSVESAAALIKLKLTLNVADLCSPVWARFFLNHYGIPFEMLKSAVIDIDAYADKIIETLVELGIVTID